MLATNCVWTSGTSMLSGSVSSLLPRMLVAVFLISGDDYSGWSIGKSHTAAIKELVPVEGMSKTRQAEYDLVHQAIMADIMESRMYRETELQALFRHYLTKAPASRRSVVEDVVMTLRDKFDVC